MGGCISRCRDLCSKDEKTVVKLESSDKFEPRLEIKVEVPGFPDLDNFNEAAVDVPRDKVDVPGYSALDKFNEVEDAVPRDEYRADREKTPKIKKKKRNRSGLSTYSKNGRHVIEPPFQIAAFNVRRFGTAKMESADVVNILVKIIRKFDIIVIQEVVDSSGKAIEALLEAVNEIKDDESKDDESKDDDSTPHQYSLTVSPRLGRGVQKEQYAYFYRTGRVEIKQTEVYPDPGDVFIREPYIMQVTTTALEGLEEFTIICIHTQPKAAATEIDALADVHKWTLDNMDTTNVVIIGDFNAGGSFVKAKDWEVNRLKQGDEFKWLIPDYADTTATNTLAAYDRIVVAGEGIYDAVVEGSAQVYRYDEEMGIGEQLLLQVSDHFPVHVSLKPAIHPTLKRHIKPSLSIVVADKRFPDLDFQDLRMEGALSRFKMSQTYDSEGKLARVEMRSNKITGVHSVVQTLEKIRKSKEGLVSYSLFSTLKYKLGGGDYGDEKTTFWVSIVADIIGQSFSCSVQTNLEIT